MSNIISIMNPKGGVAKTTTVVSLASFLSNSYNVAVIDMDQQSSVKTYLGEDSKFKVFNATRLSHISSLPNNPKAAIYDFLLIDTPASLDAARVQAITEVSDFIVIPTKTSSLDLEPTLRFVDTLVLPSKKPFKLLLTQVIPTSRHVEVVREKLAKQNMPMFQTSVRQYQAYMQASEQKKSIFEMGYAASYARNDYRSVAHELLALIQPIDVNKTLVGNQAAS